MNTKADSTRDVTFNKLSDKDLLVLLEDDSTEAFSELYIRYKEKLKIFCLFILKSEAIAQDVVQEIFIRIWLTRKQLNTGQSFSGYIYTLAKNQSLNELRSARRKERKEAVLLGQDEMKKTASADTDLILEEYQKILEAAVQKLPEHKRKIYLMSREEGLSHKEIAGILKLSPHTVQSHISDSIRLIKEYFIRHADVELYSILVILWMD